MIEVIRVVEYQAVLSSYHATQDDARATQLELLIESTKPKNLYSAWHPLIATPFRYNPPHPNARFRPPFGRNVFYASLQEETTLYEHAYHFMKERMHLNIKIETGIRTLFYVDADDKDGVDIKQLKESDVLLDKNNYTASQQYIDAHQQVTFLFYPSCRDPKHRDNAAVFAIERLGKNPTWEASIKFFYDNKAKAIKWIDHQLLIGWQEVA